MGLQQWIVDAIAFRFAHFDVELQPTYTREIKLPRIEKHRFEQTVGSLDSRRITRTHLSVDFKQCVYWFGNDIFLQCQRKNRTNVVAFRKENREALNTGFDNLLELGGRNLVVGF